MQRWTVSSIVIEISQKMALSSFYVVNCVASWLVRICVAQHGDAALCCSTLRRRSTLQHTLQHRDAIHVPASIYLRRVHCNTHIVHVHCNTHIVHCTPLVHVHCNTYTHIMHVHCNTHILHCQHLSEARALQHTYCALQHTYWLQHTATHTTTQTCGDAALRRRISRVSLVQFLRVAKTHRIP